MRIVFMGTPDFAACSLKKLLDSGYDVAAVFTQPDRPKGRGHKLAACEVKQLALEAGLPVYQPEKLRDGSAFQLMKDLSPDLIVVVAYGRILPDDILELPPLGCINIHGSVLPKYRGSAPIQWTVINGDKTAGVSSMYMASEMDAGDVIFCEETPVGEFETAGELFDRLAPMGAELLVKTIRALEDGSAVRHPQDPDAVSFAPPLTKEMAVIDWRKSPKAIIKHIYGMQPWPGAVTMLQGTPFKIFSAEYTDTVTDKKPGSVVYAGKKGIEVACGEGQTILITELQAAGGGKRMSAGAYLLGHPMEV